MLQEKKKFTSLALSLVLLPWFLLSTVNLGLKTLIENVRNHFLSFKFHSLLKNTRQSSTNPARLWITVQSIYSETHIVCHYTILVIRSTVIVSQCSSSSNPSLAVKSYITHKVGVIYFTSPPKHLLVFPQEGWTKYYVFWEIAILQHYDNYHSICSAWFPLLLHLLLYLICKLYHRHVSRYKVWCIYVVSGIHGPS